MAQIPETEPLAYRRYKSKLAEARSVYGISRLGLSPRTDRRFSNYGFRTIRDVVDLSCTGEIGYVARLGPKGLSEVFSALGNLSADDKQRSEELFSLGMAEEIRQSCGTHVLGYAALDLMSQGIDWGREWMDLISALSLPQVASLDAASSAVNVALKWQYRAGIITGCRDQTPRLTAVRSDEFRLKLSVFPTVLEHRLRFLQRSLI